MGGMVACGGAYAAAPWPEWPEAPWPETMSANGSGAASNASRAFPPAKVEDSALGGGAFGGTNASAERMSETKGWPMPSAG